MSLSPQPDLLAGAKSAPANWPLAFCAGLLGIGQNGLLVALPVLVSMTHLSLSVWAGLLTLGSMLFLVGSPYWGRQCEVRGCKYVVLMALGGYLLSFALLALAVWGLAAGWLPSLAGLGALVAARVIYGLTVSGMVPPARPGRCSAPVTSDAWRRWPPSARG
ncbi:Uncharacterised protein [Serratia rubidaea]|uniref:Major Facilitator Superfamily n=1 Tax=Serratia rubidaea TaxID=61652 RepID=A0A4U9HES2_SERRU|nr:Uncharacterised protein [Serratia rubidaea]